MSFHFTKLASSKINTKLLHAAQCALCPLANNPKNKNSNMPPDGSLHPDVLLLGLGPGEIEDAKGKPFVGPSGEFLRSCFSEDQWEKTRRNNVTRTRELNNKPPLEAVECCRPSVEKDILATKPKAIFGFGEYPLKWILGDKFTDEIKVNVWRNRHFPVSVKGHEMWYFPMFHPLYIIRSNKNKPELIDLFKRDIKSAYDFLSKGIKPHVVKPSTYFDGVEIEYKSIAKVEQFINELLKTSNRFAIDIETAATLPPGHNLYRPYHQNSKILTVSIGTFQKCMAFPLDHPEAKWTENERKKLDLLLLKLLLSNLIKEAHNSVYELEWLLYKYSKKIAYKNWICTLTQGYILNGRRGLLGLGELTLLYFGFNLKHLSHVDSANLATEPLEDVLTYNAMDVKYTDAIYLHQKELLEEDPTQLEVFNRQNRKLPAVVLTQIKGIQPDLEEAHRINKDADIKVQNTLNAINNNKDVKEFISRFGGFNPNSPADVINLFKYLGFDLSKEVVTKTDEGRKVETKDSSDEETLSKIDHPVAKWILEIRSNVKLQSGFIEPIIGKESLVYPDGKLHTNLNVNSTATLRLCIAKGSKIEIVRDISKYPNGIPIEDVKVGDLAYSYNANGQLEIKKVKWAGYTGKKKVIRLYWKAHSKSGYLDLTPTHEILQSNNNYINAENSISCSIKALARGIKDFEIIPNNHFIYKIEELPDEVDVYDLEIEDNNNFIANELCVHNSSDSPNIQQFPKHTTAAIVRKIFKVPKGCKLVALDYGQIEYRTGVMNSKDPVLRKAVFMNYDVHRDWAIRIAKAYPKRVGGDLNKFLNDKTAIKELRSTTKNQWVFAGMFNASVKSKAEGMGIPFDIAKELDKQFWAELKTLKEWQNKTYEFVRKNGYVETLTNYRRRYGKRTPYLEMGEIVNTPIQESAATIVMDAFCRISEYAIETNQEKYTPIWQLHDDLGFIFPEETVEEDYNKIAYMMLDCKFPFINVPLAVEVSIGDNWLEMHEVKTITSVDVGLMENPYKENN